MLGAVLGAVLVWGCLCPSSRGAGILQGEDSKQPAMNEGEKTQVAGERAEVYPESLGSAEVSCWCAYGQRAAAHFIMQ